MYIQRTWSAFKDGAKKSFTLKEHFYRKNQFLNLTEAPFSFLKFELHKYNVSRYQLQNVILRPAALIFRQNIQNATTCFWNRFILNIFWRSNIVLCQWWYNWRIKLQKYQSHQKLFYFYFLRQSLALVLRKNTYIGKTKLGHENTPK